MILKIWVIVPGWRLCIYYLVTILKWEHNANGFLVAIIQSYTHSPNIFVYLFPYFLLFVGQKSVGWTDDTLATAIICLINDVRLLSVYVSHAVMYHNKTFPACLFHSSVFSPLKYQGTICRLSTHLTRCSLWLFELICPPRI